MNNHRTYIAIDLKSFYASVECRQRNLDPLTTNLVVADESRTEKTICLAVTPSLKSYGIPGRSRLFEVIQKVKQANNIRKLNSPDKELSGSSVDANELMQNPRLAIDYIVAEPRMGFYMDYSTRIYEIYLKYISADDMHIYSIDEVFMDVTNYLNTYQMTAKQLAVNIIQDVLRTTGITATVGIGTNLYLCKIAMDVVAKHIEPDKDGVRIAQLDEMSYRQLLWKHRPITDFWRIGRGYAKTLENNGIYTMGDIARCSLGKANEHYNEELLYKLFGVNAELLIDHAWGFEPCTIADIKAYRPMNNSLCSGQVLQSPYSSDEARLVVQEMLDMLSLDLVDKKLVTDQIVLTIGYDVINLTDSKLSSKYKGEITTDRYDRKIPKHAHGTANLDRKTASTMLITEAALNLYDNIVNKDLLIRRINISANHVVSDSLVENEEKYEQMSLFTNYEDENNKKSKEKKILEREKNLQKTMIEIKKKYGKNAILKGMNLQKRATAKDRNSQIGGHKA